MFFEIAAAKLLDFFWFFFFAVLKYVSQGILSENFALPSIFWAIIGVGTDVAPPPPPRGAGFFPQARTHGVKLSKLVPFCKEVVQQTD